MQFFKNKLKKVNLEIAWTKLYMVFPGFQKFFFFLSFNEQG